MTEGQCCFCGKDVETTVLDPCLFKVLTNNNDWEVWTCHGACFRERVMDVQHLARFFESP